MHRLITCRVHKEFSRGYDYAIGVALAALAIAAAAAYIVPMVTR